MIYTINQYNSVYIFSMAELEYKNKDNVKRKKKNRELCCEVVVYNDPTTCHPTVHIGPSDFTGLYRTFPSVKSLL